MNNNRPHSHDIEALISDPNPLWLWDGISGRIYWANEAGLRFWAAKHLDELRAMHLDHAMPALRRLKKLALEDVPEEGCLKRLLFWTLAGHRPVNCHCRKINVEGYGDLLLIRLEDGEGGENMSASTDVENDAREHDARENISDATGQNTSVGSDESDVAATLREIARQVRAARNTSKTHDDKASPTSDASGEPIPSNARAGQKDNSKTDYHDFGGDQRSIEDVEYLAKISHEIRTPLNSILGFSELMMEERLGALKNEKYAEYISDIHHSAQLALSLINDMLDISRMNAGLFDVSAEKIDLNELARSMASIMRPQAQKKTITLKIEPGGDELIILAGQRSVKQILLKPSLQRHQVYRDRRQRDTADRH